MHRIKNLTVEQEDELAKAALEVLKGMDHESLLGYALLGMKSMERADLVAGDCEKRGARLEDTLSFDPFLRAKFTVICTHEGCPNFGKVINEITAPVDDDDPEFESMFEGWGQGANDDEDYCRECKDLGVLLDEYTVS